MEEKLMKALKEISDKNNGKITCAQAWEIADKFSLTKKEVGDKINELKIKITKCQLGCF
jgi:LAO/AO transport system kinase